MNLVVNIDVPDLDAAVTFYEDALGLILKRRLFAGQVAEMAGASSTVHLLQKATRTQATGEGDALRDYSRHWTPVHLDFMVDDLDVAVERARKAGARMEIDVRTYNWGRIAVLSDPFGHGFCLIELSAMGYESVE